MRHLNFLFSVLLLGAVALTGTPAQAQGQEGSVLFVAPHRLIISPGQKSETISVTNKSDEPRRYDLVMIDQVMDANGVTQRVDTYQYSIKKIVEFRPKRFTLEPGKSQVVRVVANRPAGMADGDYHSHLLFREVPLSMKDKAQMQQERSESDKSVTFEIRTLYGIGVPIVVQHGKISSDIAMGEPRLDKPANAKFRQLTVDFTRTGNAESAGKLSVDYVAGGGAPVPVIDPQWVRLYREVGQITKKFDLVKLPEGASGGKLVMSLARDENDPSRTIKKEIPLN